MRYISDVRAIQRQISFQQKHACIDYDEVVSHNQTLADIGLNTLPLEAREDLPTGQLSQNEIIGLLPFVKKLRPRIDELHSDCLRDGDVIAESSLRARMSEHFEVLGPEKLARIDTLISKYTEILLQGLSDQQLVSCSNDDLTRFITASKAVDIEVPHVFEEFDLERLVQSAVYDARLQRLWDKASRLVDLNARLEDIELIAESGNSPVSLMRQAFIAMMASFDAALADLVRDALEKDFFNLVRKLDKKDRVALDISTAHSWESLSKALIESQARKHYAIGWIRAMKSRWKVFDGHNFGAVFVEICEQIKRRNIHLHNRGIVDEEYCRDTNIKRLSVGAHAVITEPYWETARLNNERLIKHVALWVDNHL